MYISKYHVTRHYGGPEEGGWWYDRHEFIHVIHQIADENLAYALARELNAKAKLNKEQPDGARYQGRFSVADPTDTVYYAERNRAEHHDLNEPRPRYM